MTVFAMPMTMDRLSSRRRTSWSMTASMIIHSILLLLLVTAKTPESKLPEITEILMIEPGDLAAPAASSPAAPSASSTPGLAKANVTEERFARSLNQAALEPAPQSRTAIEDRIASRLASLQQNEPLAVAGTGAAGVPSAAWGPATAVTGTGTGGKALSLTRGGSGGSGPALSLTRGTGTSGIGPATVSTGIPTEGSAAGAPAKSSESSARRNLAGATLMGPIADRPVITYATPVYPDWAKRDAVEGSVTLYFVVRPDGSVKENVLVQKTAGFDEFDENARAALKAWKFQPLTGGRTGEQWGTITFHFRIREAG
ncbi:MAG TPA: energy transducer TonB [Candidatus Eisenbacteria bacterium]|nr:energy transducer TonB [Candidatus Eisenbacteria bacterium]